MPYKINALGGENEENNHYCIFVSLRENTKYKKSFDTINKIDQAIKDSLKKNDIEFSPVYGAHLKKLRYGYLGGQ